LGPLPGLRRAMTVRQRQDGTVTVQNRYTLGHPVLAVAVVGVGAAAAFVTGHFPVQVLFLLGAAAGWGALQFHLELRATRWRVRRGFGTSWFARAQAAEARALLADDMTEVRLVSHILEQPIARFRSNQDAEELVSILHDYARADGEPPCGCAVCAPLMAG